MSKIETKDPSSFRDPSGFLFYRDGTIYRQINLIYKEHYDLLMQSGLYKNLVGANLLIPHEEVAIEPAQKEQSYKIIKPQPIPFVSYPYEWCFSQLKDAALLTLAIQKMALALKMSLKDASAYNIQFIGSKPMLIDTLSFEKYRENEPWIAYRQFCQHFLAPLALMSYADVRLSQLLKIYIDGIPLDLAKTLLPLRTKFRFSLLSHIHLHAASQKHFADKSIKPKGRKVSYMSLSGLINNLESGIRSLEWKPESTEWAKYYEDTNYTEAAMNHKNRVVAEFLDMVKPDTVWDLGANVGTFSRIAASKAIQTISFDLDPAAVELSYLDCKKSGETKILPLVLDLTNPTPAIGWENRERMSFLQRAPADAVFALAIVHHLAISNNLPIGAIAAFLEEILKRSLIIEFVPKDDSQVQKLLAAREDIFPDYNQEAFEREFERYFTIQKSVQIIDSKRTLYLMEKRWIG